MCFTPALDSRVFYMPREVGKLTLAEMPANSCVSGEIFDKDEELTRRHQKGLGETAKRRLYLKKYQGISTVTLQQANHPLGVICSDQLAKAMNYFATYSRGPTPRPSQIGQKGWGPQF